MLDDLGGRKSLYDKALILWHDDDRQLCGILVTHVDDFIYCGTKKWIESVIENLLKIFKISKLEKGSFKYTG